MPFLIPTAAQLPSDLVSAFPGAPGDVQEMLACFVWTHLPAPLQPVTMAHAAIAHAAVAAAAEAGYYGTHLGWGLQHLVQAKDALVRHQGILGLDRFAGTGQP